MDGTRCTCGGGCLTFGECVRRKGLRIGYCQSHKGHARDATSQRVHDRELDLYRSARAQGVQPAGTSTAASQYALDQSDKSGKPFNAETFGGMVP